MARTPPPASRLALMATGISDNDIAIEATKLGPKPYSRRGISWQINGKNRLADQVALAIANLGGVELAAEIKRLADAEWLNFKPSRRKAVSA